jgi:hypothetical protein
MRIRRFSAVRMSHTGRDVEGEDCLSMPALSETSSSMSYTSSFTEDESEQGAYWRRLSDRRKEYSNHDPFSTEVTNLSPFSSRSVTEFVERELIAKLEGLMDLSNASHGTGSNQRRYAERFGVHEEQARDLDYTRQDLYNLMDDQEFRRLQRSLRNKGAVTNEVLKQVLPLVVRQSKISQERRRSSIQIA